MSHRLDRRAEGAARPGGPDLRQPARACDSTRATAPPRAVALATALLDRAHATGRFPTFQELALDDELDTSGLDELEAMGAVLWLPPPIGPYDERARRTLVLTRNAVRLLPEERAARELAAVIAVRDGLEWRLRASGQPTWLPLKDLALAIGRTDEGTAVALVLLLADERSRNIRHLDPYGGCPHEIEVDLELAAADPSPSTTELELLTSAQAYALRAAQARTAAAPDDVGSAYVAKPEAEASVVPEPGRRGRGKGGRLSTAELLEPYKADFQRRWELGEFASATDARKELQALINREGDRVLVEGEDGYKDFEDVRLRTKGWFPRERRGCRVGGPTAAGKNGGAT